MANILQGLKEVVTISGAIVKSNSGAIVTVKAPSGRTITEKQFVGSRETKPITLLADWIKTQKPF